jgi:hypothetical protein
MIEKPSTAATLRLPRGGLPLVARVQLKAREVAFRGDHSERDGERVRDVRRLDRQAVMGS